jgi:hypothetical protein
MTNNNTKKGQPAPESKHPEVDRSDNPFHLFGGIVGAAAIFLAIWIVAVVLGYVVHWTKVECPWVPSWVIFIGHVVEAALFVADMLVLMTTIVRHIAHHLVGTWRMIRGFTKG